MKTVGIVVPPLMEYARGIRRGVFSAIASEQGWQVIELPYHESGDSPVREGIESLDGVIAWVDERSTWLVDAARLGIPVVNCGGDFSDIKEIATIGVNTESVVELAVKHMTELDLPEIWFFGNQVSQSKGRLAMLERIRERVSPMGIKTGYLETTVVDPNEDLSVLLAPDLEKNLKGRFDNLKHPAGLICENDTFARLACDFAGLLGIRVPTDLAIMGAGDSAIGRYGAPTLTTIRLPGAEVGKWAFEIVLNAQSAGEIPEEILMVDASEIIVRESTGGKGIDIVLEKVFRRIEMEALSGIKFGELAEYAGISPKSLRSRYRKVYQEEPTEHIRRLRVEEAKRLLTTGEQTIAGIAAACGFSSQSSFANYFLRHTGMSPQEHRQKESD